MSVNDKLGVNYSSDSDSDIDSYHQENPYNVKIVKDKNFVPEFKYVTKVRKDKILGLQKYSKQFVNPVIAHQVVNNDHYLLNRNDKTFTDYVRENFQSDFILKKYAITPASSEMNTCFLFSDLFSFKLHLKRYLTRRPMPNTEYLSYFKLEVDRHLNFTRHKVGGGWSSRRALSVIQMKRSYPGLRWKKNNFDSKQEAMLPAFNECVTLINRMKRKCNSSYIKEKYACDNRSPFYVMDDGTFVPKFIPATVATRGKRVPIGQVGNLKRKGRMIVMPDTTYHMLCSLFAMHVKELLRSNSDVEGRAMLGFSTFHSNYNNLYASVYDADLFLSIDFSGFDQTIPKNCLIVMLDELLTRFNHGDSTWFKKSMRQVIIDNFISNEIALPDGLIVKKDRGISSGDPLTSSFGGLFNLIATRVILRLMGHTFKNFAFGDDGLIAIYLNRDNVLSRTSSNHVHDNGREFFFKKKSWAELGLKKPKHTRFDFKLMERMFYEIFGLEIKASATKISSHLSFTLHEGDTNVDFLSNYFIKADVSNEYFGFVPFRPISDLIQQLCTPEIYRPDNDWRFLRLQSLYLLYYYNLDAIHLIMNYYNYLITVKNHKPIISKSRHEIEEYFMKKGRPLILLNKVGFPDSAQVLNLYHDYSVLNNYDEEHMRIRDSLSRLLSKNKTLGIYGY